MTLRELVTTWGFDIDDKPLKELEEKFKGLKETAIHLIELFAEEAFVIFELTETTADAAREASNLAMAMGTTSQEIQKLEFAAKFAGVNAEGLGTGLRRLSVNAVDAAKGGAESSMVFARLGINIMDSSGKLKNSTTLLKDMAEAFHGMPDDAFKTEAAVKLLGRTGSNLIPILNKGRHGLKELGDESVTVGYTMSEITVKQGVRFMEMLHELEAIFQGLARTIGVRMLPVFIDLMGKLKEWYDANKEVIAQHLESFVWMMADSLEALWDFTKKVIDVIGWLTGDFKHLGTILTIVVALMAAFAAANTVMAIAGIITAVIELTEALSMLSIMEAFASGGLSLIAAGAAAVAAGGIAAYLMSGSKHSSKFSAPVGAPTPGAPYFPGQIGSSQIPVTSGVQVVQHNHFNLPPGTSADHAKQVGELSGKALQEHIQGAAVTFTGGPER